MLRTTLLLTACALGAPVLPQSKEVPAKPLTARGFHFDSHKTVLRLDSKEVRDAGVWDEINTSAQRMLFGLIEKDAVFPLDRLDRVTMTGVRLFRPPWKKIEHERRGTDAIWRVDLGRAPVEAVEEEPTEKPKAGGGE